MKPKIAVFGVGGAGCNAVNNMISSNLAGVEYYIANTDSQSLEGSLDVAKKIRLGASCTKGLGAGSHPEIGKAAAEESIDDLRASLESCNMVFITAGMGGGTGTGAAPVVGRIAREVGALAVGVVTKPFHFEGARRMKIAELGLEEMRRNVDTLVIIPNQNLFRIANEKTTFLDAFKKADEVLHSAVRGVTDLITVPGLINLDFADIRTIIQEMGAAMIGIGEAEGEDRAKDAANAAISNPLLDSPSMKGAKAVLVNITGGMDMTLFEVDEAINRVREEVDESANIIFGSAFNKDLEGKIKVSILATGIGDKNAEEKEKHAMHFTLKKQTTPNTQSQQEVIVQSKNDAEGGAEKDIKENFSYTQIEKEFADDSFLANQINKDSNKTHKEENINASKESAARDKKDDVFNIPAFFRKGNFFQ
ncbi:MAG: cell division protein FtsZ [Proteobacteria bacterium]|nr:cell division protein FtsZ [Pseudomonadota bacterium]